MRLSRWGSSSLIACWPFIETSLRGAEPDAIKELFKNLLSMEENAEHRFACDAARFDDL